MNSTAPSSETAVRSIAIGPVCAFTVTSAIARANATANRQMICDDGLTKVPPFHSPS